MIPREPGPWSAQQAHEHARLRGTGRSYQAAARALECLRRRFRVIIIAGTTRQAQLAVYTPMIRMAADIGFTWPVENVELAGSHDIAERLHGRHSRRWRVVFDHTAVLDDDARYAVLADPGLTDWAEPRVIEDRINWWHAKAVHEDTVARRGRCWRCRAVETFDPTPAPQRDPEREAIAERAAAAVRILTLLALLTGPGSDPSSIARLVEEP